MPRLLLVGLFLTFVASGCVMLDKRTQGFTSRPSCHPSQYWDGSQCRHKGKGHGARKHDGVPASSASRGKKR